MAIVNQGLWGSCCCLDNKPWDLVAEQIDLCTVDHLLVELIHKSFRDYRYPKVQIPMAQSGVVLMVPMDRIAAHKLVPLDLCILPGRHFVVW